MFVQMDFIEILELLIKTFIFINLCYKSRYGILVVDNIPVNICTDAKKERRVHVPMN